MVIRIANYGRQKTFVRLWHVALRLGKVGTDTLLAILLCFLLGLLEDELRYMAVEVFICDCARDR